MGKTKKKVLYAVRRGFKCGVFDTWDGACKSISGFSGAKHKKFLRKTLAQRYVTGSDLEITMPEFISDKETLVIYTDGHHAKGTSEKGFGFCTWAHGKYFEYASGHIEKNTEASNGAMEMAAVVCVYDMILRSDSFPYNQVTFHSDLNLVQKYGTGEYRASNCSQKTPRFREIALDFQAKQLSVEALGVHFNFFHVDGHSNDPGNDLADNLAKSDVPKNTFVELIRGDYE